MPSGGSQIPQLTPQDLQDPTLFKLNQVLGLIAGKVSDIYNPGQETSLGATLTVPAVIAGTQSTTPTNGNTLITLALAQKLFGAATTRTALATGSAPGITEIVQPISGGGGSSSASTSAPFTVVDKTLSANATISTPTPTLVGQGLAYFIRQNGTGGFITTWSSPPFRGATSSAHSGQIGLGTLKNTWSLILFVSETDPADGVLKWWKACLVTNQT